MQLEKTLDGQQITQLNPKGFEGWTSLQNSPIQLQALLWIIAISGIVIDQATKWWIEDNLEIYEAIQPFPAIAHIFQILHTFNTGAAFGMFQGFGWLFSAVAFVVAGFILFYNAIILEKAYTFRVAMGLILGGALGNVIDRIRIGQVTDFFHFNFLPLVEDYPALQFRYLNFPIFNFADIFIVSGVFTLVYLMWRDNLPEDPWTEYEEVEDEFPASSVQPVYASTRAAVPAVGLAGGEAARNGSTSIRLTSRPATPIEPRQPVEPNDKAKFGMRVLILLIVFLNFTVVGLLIWFSRRWGRRG